ncbi:MAG: DUF1311 domain-containing protein [Silicimonas sp.]|nr:DUF1311 domain-containing protein [Silicimonas sp.]
MKPMNIHTLALSALAGSLAITPASATEHEVGEFGHLLDACYASATDAQARQACIGAMSTVCMDQDGGQTTLGMSSCLNAEAEVWDALLNKEYKGTRAWMTAADADEAEYFPDFARRAETLLAAQRAWIVFRDAQCDLAFALWGSGSMRSIAWADCRMQITADRTLELRSMREAFE